MDSGRLPSRHPAPSRARSGLAFGGGALAILALYAATSFSLFDAAPLVGQPNAVFDLDTYRIADDWATPLPSYRTTVHPLAKLLLAPVGLAIRRSFDAATHPADAARVIGIAAMTLQCLLVGVLARQLAGGALLPGLLAMLLCAGSFSSFLLGVIPDSASLSGLGSVVPMIYLNRRWRRSFTGGEAACWGAIGCLAFAWTSTQVLHWVVALGIRIVLHVRGEASGASVRLRSAWPRLAGGVALAAALVLAGTWIQSARYPGSLTFYTLEKIVGREQRFMRLEDLREEPVHHGVRLASHFLGKNFVAPAYEYSPRLLLSYDVWQLSIEEQGLRDLPPPALALVVLLALLAGGAALGLWRTRDPRFAAPLLGIASQLALHALYGAEYIIYSPNWHGLVVAVLVAACWAGLPRRHAWVAGLAGALAIGTAANSAVVLHDVARELRIGLHSADRDAKGRPLARGGAPGAAVEPPAPGP